MSNYKYILEPYKGLNTRYTCPNCGKANGFVRYIDASTGNHLRSTVGRCNRENSCGYHYTPKQYFTDNNISFNTPQPDVNKLRHVTPHKKPVSFIDVDIFKNSLATDDTNCLVKYLKSIFGNDITHQLISKYYIGSSSHWFGATVFWQVDTLNKVRTGKIMLYSPVTGKRVKEPYNHVNWVHRVSKLPDFNLQQCFFGEHLIKDNHGKPIALVESEKTAIIASAYLPEFIWLAAGSINNIGIDKIEPLKGRQVCLFPDADSYARWSKKANEFSSAINVNVSTLLETKCTKEEKLKGLDIADFLIKFKHKDF